MVWVFAVKVVRDVYGDIVDGSMKTCGGTLVASKYVVTAAHCVSGAEQIRANFGVEDIFMFDMFDDMYDPEKKEDDRSLSMRVSKTMIHEDYNSYTGENNIAVLELIMKIDTDVYPPACLAKTSDTTSFYGKKAQVYGYTPEKTWKEERWHPPPSAPLHVVTIPVVSKAKCEQALGYSVGDGHLCAGGEDGKDACNLWMNMGWEDEAEGLVADDGGPLTHFINGQHVLIGVVGDIGGNGKGWDCGKV